jgi:hypothetical protein
MHAFPTRNHSAPNISQLCRDPVLAAIFRRAEDDDQAPAGVDRPIAPRLDGVAAQRILEMA